VLDVEQTIVSQYGQAQSLRLLITSFNDVLDPTILLNAFYTQVWNVDTASGYGLDVWGRIVGVGRVLNLPTGSYFGFAEPGDPSETGFNQSPLYSGTAATSNYTLTDDAYRRVIYAKALYNITDGSILGINRILHILWPDNNAYCTDGGDMTMTYTFDFQLSALDFAILTQTGAIPKPAAVLATIVQGS
jgi:hypothetical protein